jgi:glutamate dehydrogenase
MKASLSAQSRNIRNLRKMTKRSITTTVATAVDTKLSAEQMWEGPHVDAAYVDSIASIKSQVPGFAYAEMWAPDSNGDLVGKHNYLASELLEQHSQAAQDYKNNPADGDDVEVLEAFKTGKTIVLKSKNHKFGAAPFNTGFVVPVRHNGKVKAVMRVFSQRTERDFDGDEVDTLVQGIVSAAMYGNTKHYESLPFVQHNPKVSLETQKQVYLGLVSNGVFSPSRAFAEVDAFFKMGFAPIYFKRFQPRVLANHIQAFIASKQFAQASANPEEVWLAIENNVKFMGGLPPEQSFHIVPTEQRKVFAVERNIIRRVNHIPANKNYALEMSTSSEPIVAGSKKNASMYVLQTHDYVEPENVGNEAITQLDKICSTAFMANKTKRILNRYQEVITEAASSLSPVAKVYEAHEDGSIPVMFAFRARGHAGAHSNYLLQMTQLLENNKLKASRKFVESFANNVTVMSLYLDPADAAKVKNFTEEFSMMSLTPQSDVLTPQFLSGAITAEEYSYLSATSKVLYYVISSRSDEYNMLSKHLEKDTLNLGRLRNLYTSIRREAVSHSRIQKTMLKYPELAKAIYQDFELRTTTDQVNGPKIPQNADLATKIKRTVIGTMEQQIFQAMLTFNHSVPKTNFFRGTKAAISFRLEPEFFADMDLPRLPFGVFFVMGADFQAFHVRFADVSRGGIRLIQSRDDNVYSKNVASQFNETFNLAFTQNLKNKDIPEFGSKGTVLLNPDSQHQGIISFQRMVDSLLDLITEPGPNVKPGHPHHIVNNYGKEELLFLGPDEGTAGVMQWAANYSKTRGYKYPLAFTTGKPASLGGIPHDVYGMTTNSVHRFVVGALKKLGLKEEECTKVQTGGPDGDLGSNEVLISKDKTIAIVDGSGVLYDPKGIDRTELTRLCHARVMSNNFDKSKLSSEGFFVSVDQNDVTLPDGTVVESGIAFRNEFHLTKFSTGDLFVPCGGRPASVDLGNVGRMFDPKTGKPKFKVIIEGANLFITQDARLVLEEAGVVLYKDASSNKGGVTSSSLEVLAALSLPTDVFETQMAVHDPKNPPAAYDQYAREIQGRIIQNADLEFECIWKEHERTGLPRYILTDKVSNKINTLNDFIHASNLWDNKALRNVVLKELLPKKLQDLVGFDKIVETAPESYLKASFSAYLSSRYVYKYGIDATEFAFFDYMAPYVAKSLEEKK